MIRVRGVVTGFGLTTASVAGIAVVACCDAHGRAPGLAAAPKLFAYYSRSKEVRVRDGGWVQRDSCQLSGEHRGDLVTPVVWYFQSHVRSRAANVSVVVFEGEGFPGNAPRMKVPR
jgi:hypothetical protein